MKPGQTRYHVLILKMYSKIKLNMTELRPLIQRHVFLNKINYVSAEDCFHKY